MFIFYEFRPFLYRYRARYLSKNTVIDILYLFSCITYLNITSLQLVR